MNHRRTPGQESHIVLLPVALPAGGKAPTGQNQDDRDGRTLAALCATELLQNYEILDYERFKRALATRNLAIDSILVNGIGKELSKELGIDAVLVSEVYSWEPGTPGFWFLAKDGRIGFQARLVDLASGAVIWSVNRVRQTRAGDPLSVGLGDVFADLAAVMPRNLSPY
jgi:hypothetical protein